jgi:hypothetical protein
MRGPFQGAFGPIGSFFMTIVSTVSSIINAIIGVFLGGIGIIGGVVVGIISAVATFFGGLLGGLTGTTAPNQQASSYDVHIGADGLRRTVSNLQSDVQAMKFDQLPPGGGVYVDGGVNSTDSGWENFTLYGDGSVRTISGTRGFVWVKSGKVSRHVYGVYNKQTASDLQVSAIVLRTLFQPGSGDYILARVGDSGNSFIYCFIYGTGVRIGCMVDGVNHTFDTALGTPTPGSLWELQCGTETNDRKILVYQNRKTVFEYDDDAHIAKMGAGYRSGGMGMSSGPNSAGETVPGDIGQYSLRDIAPPSVLGTVLKVKNLSATQYTMPGGGIIQSLSNGYFNTVEYVSDDVDWDPAQTMATMKTEGPYRIEFGILFASYYSSVQVYPAYFQNTGVPAAGPIWTSGGTQSQIKQIVGGYDTYCREGDILLPALGVVTSGSLKIQGDPGGMLSWMTITRLPNK